MRLDRFDLTTVRRLGAATAIGLALTAVGLSACDNPPAAVDQARLEAADKEPGNWMSHGRTWSEQR